MDDLYTKQTFAEDFEQYLSSYKRFIREQERQDPTKAHILANMGATPPSGFLHLIDEERGEFRRWTKETGQIDLLFNYVEDSMVGISCVEHSTISNIFTSGGNRCWLDHRYRGNQSVTKHLLQSNLNWSEANGFSGMVLTFNEYNKGLWEIIKRRSEGKHAQFGSTWSDFWNDCIAIPEPIILHNTKQWAIIKPVPDADIKMINKEIGAILREYQSND
jgi:hypothetical protein